MGTPDDGDGRPGRGAWWLRAAAVAVVGIVGLTYTGAALVTAGPITPLSLTFTPAASKIVDPYLVQNWQLFAPDPISEERGAVARVRCADGTETEFVDITTEHIEAIHDTRFFPSRQSRVISNGMFNMFLEDPYLSRYRDSVDETATEAASDLLVHASPEELELREQGEQVLANFAAWSLADSCPDGVEAAQLRYVLHQFPRWSERDRWEDDGDVEILESAWLSIS